LSPDQQAARWVLCDLGNVLVDFDHLRAAQGFLGHIRSQPAGSRIQGRDLHAFLFGPGPEGISRNRLLELGRRELGDVRAEMCVLFGITIGEETFEELWSSIFEEFKPESLECLAKVRTAGGRVAICSNTNRAHWDFLCRKLPALTSLADECFLSFRMGVAKPSPEYFRQIAGTTHAPPEDHLLVDDLSENLEAARRAGMRGILVTTSMPCGEILGFVQRSRGS
jgi:HAD superfamily hydrolase (TIGR01509 family)